MSDVTTEVTIDRPGDEALALLLGIRDALDVPHAATVAGAEPRNRILNARVTLVKMTVDTLMGSACPDVTDAMKELQERLADYPVIGYVTQKKAKRRLDAGATWSEATSLDYRDSEATR